MATNHKLIDWNEGIGNRYTLTFERESDDLLVRAQAIVIDCTDDPLNGNRVHLMEVDVDIYEVTLTDQEGNPVAGSFTKEETKEMEEESSEDFFEYFEERLSEAWKVEQDYQEACAEDAWDSRNDY